MSGHFRDCFLIPVFFVLAGCFGLGCADEADEDRFSAEEKRAELRRLVREGKPGEMMDEVVIEEPSPSTPEEDFPDSDSAEELLPLLDSSLASGDDEAALDYMLELEDRGGDVAVKGLGMVIDHALDEDLKLDAIASLSMMEEDDISAPLLRAMNDQSEEVQIAALEVIADSEMVNLLPALRMRMGRESTESVLEAIDEAIVELEYLQELDRGD